MPTADEFLDAPGAQSADDFLGPDPGADWQGSYGVSGMPLREKIARPVMDVLDKPFGVLRAPLDDVTSQLEEEQADTKQPQWQRSAAAAMSVPTEVASQFITPENAVIAASPMAAGPAMTKIAWPLVDAYFAKQMGEGALQQIPGLGEAIGRRDWPEVVKRGGSTLVQAIMTLMAGKGMGKGLDQQLLRVDPETGAKMDESGTVIGQVAQPGGPQMPPPAPPVEEPPAPPIERIKRGGPVGVDSVIAEKNFNEATAGAPTPQMSADEFLGKLQEPAPEQKLLPPPESSPLVDPSGQPIEPVTYGDAGEQVQPPAMPRRGIRRARLDARLQEILDRAKDRGYLDEGVPEQPQETAPAAPEEAPLPDIPEAEQWTPEKAERRVVARDLTPENKALADKWYAERRAQDAALDQNVGPVTEEDINAEPSDIDKQVEEAMAILQGRREARGAVDTGQLGSLTRKARPEDQVTGDADAIKRLRSLQRNDNNPLAAHGQNVLEQADPDAYMAYNRGAGARGHARILVGRMNETIENQVGAGHSDRFRQAMVESNVAGQKEKWADLKKIVDTAPPDDLIDHWSQGYDDTFSAAANMLFDSAERGKIKAAATRAFTNNRPEVLRDLVSQVFQEAYHEVPDLSPATAAYMESPEFKKAFDVSQPVRDAFAAALPSNKGKATSYVGKSGAYWPTVAVDAETGETVHPNVAGEGKSRYSKQIPGNVKMRTGLSDAYSHSTEDTMDRLSASLRAAGRNDTVDALIASGIAKELKPGDKSNVRLDAIPGAHEPVVRKEVSPLRVVDGKRVPAKVIEMPASIAKEMAPFFEPTGKFEEGKFANAVLEAILRGWGEPIGHSFAQWGNLAVALGRTPPEGVGRSLLVDYSKPDTLRMERKLGALGIVPDRYGSVSASEATAKNYGAEYKMGADIRKLSKENAHGLGSFAPAIFGPEGVDMRNRIAAGLWFEKSFPEAGDAEMLKFQRKLGNYVGAARNNVARAVINPAISPFFTAGSTTLRNFGSMFGIGDAGPKGTSKAGWIAQRQSTSGAIAAVTLWYGLYKGITGKFPHEDPNQDLFKIPIPKEYRDTPLVHLFYSEDQSKQKYLDLGRLFPVLDKGLRMTGVKGAYHALARGGTANQATGAALLQSGNTALGFLSPITRIYFALGTGANAYLAHDFQGSKTALVETVPPNLKNNEVGKRLYAAAENVAPQSMFTGTELFGSGEGPKSQPRLPRSIANTVFPGIIGNEENVQRSRQNFKREANRIYKPR